MATRRQRFDDLERKGPAESANGRSVGEEGEYQDLLAEKNAGGGNFLDEAGHDPDSDNPAVPQTTTQEVAQSAEDNPDAVTGEPQLKADKPADAKQKGHK